jgi:hypothetical protein
MVPCAGTAFFGVRELCSRFSVEQLSIHQAPIKHAASASFFSVPSASSVLILSFSCFPLRLCNLCVNSFSSLFLALA